MCEHLLKVFPGNVEYQNRLLQTEFLKTYASMSGQESSADYRKDAGILGKGIARLDKVHRRFEQNALYFDLASNLHYLRSVKLANGGTLSEALLEIQKALAFNPMQPKGEEVKEQLVEMMHQLQDKVASLVAKVNANPERN